MKNAFSKIEQEFKGALPIAAAVFNASSQLRRLSRPIAQMSALCERPSSQCELFFPCRLRGSILRKECILHM